IRQIMPRCSSSPSNAAKNFCTTFGGGGGANERRAEGGGREEFLALAGASFPGGAGLRLFAIRVHRRESVDEALERRNTRLEPLGLRNVDEVVDAAVLLQDPDIEFLRNTVELRHEHAVHRLAVVEGDDLLRRDLAIGELDEEVLRERRE